jgi:ketosteroid isomerase-like protein
MSEENVDLAKRIVAAVQEPDSYAVLDFLDPAIEWWVPAEHPDGGRHLGHDGVRRYLDSLYDAFERLEPSIEEIYAIDNERVFVAASYRGEAKMGMEVELTDFEIWTFRDGLTVRREAYGTEAEALEAAGLSE